MQLLKFKKPITAWYLSLVSFRFFPCLFLPNLAPSLFPFQCATIVSINNLSVSWYAKPWGGTNYPACTEGAQFTQSCWIMVAWLWHAPNYLRFTNLTFPHRVAAWVHSLGSEMCLRSQCMWPPCTAFLSITVQASVLVHLSFKQTHLISSSVLSLWMIEEQIDVCSCVAGCIRGESHISHRTAENTQLKIVP